MEKKFTQIFQHNRNNIGRSIGSVKIEPIATSLDHQCVNVLERILKDPTHPITQKQSIKSHHNTKSSQHIPALLEQ